MAVDVVLELEVCVYELADRQGAAMLRESMHDKLLLFFYCFCCNVELDS